VLALLSGPISSVADLEVLLFVRRRPAGSWDSRAVADLLHIDRALSAAIFKELEGRGFLTSTTEPLLLYRYAPNSEVVAALDRLAEIYDSHRMMVIAFLAGKRTARQSAGWGLAPLFGEE
jgi:hypothetical protein